MLSSSVDVHEEDGVNLVILHWLAHREDGRGSSVDLRPQLRKVLS